MDLGVSVHICGEQGPQISFGLGAYFYCPGPLHPFKEVLMSRRKEIVLAKKCALTTRDWDTFQIIIRRCLRTKKQKNQPPEQNVHNTP